MEDIFNSWISKLPIAHRGLHDGIAPENSLSAYKKAIEKGYAIEIDIRPTKDGKIVSFHDDTLDRVTDFSGEVKNYTLDELKKAKLQNSQESIPTLDEVLSLIDGKVPLLIEIKNSGGASFEKDAYEILKNYKGEYAVQSFNPLSLAWFKKNAPNIKRGQLSCYFENEKLSFYKKFLLKRLWMNFISKPDFISYNHKDLPNKYVKKYYGKKPILAWTIRSEQEKINAKPNINNIIFENFEASLND